VRQDDEVLLVVKTRAGRLEALEARLFELHPYDVPECVALEPVAVEARYLAWLLDATTEEV
jgi:periplasmic divalent cation tolerance protein